MSEYLTFVNAAQPLGHKTKVVEVRSKNTNDALGIIKWWPAWRQYCFFPEEGTVWSIQCMDDVRNFVWNLKQRHDVGIENNIE